MPAVLVPTPSLPHSSWLPLPKAAAPSNYHSVTQPVTARVRYRPQSAGLGARPADASTGKNSIRPPSWRGASSSLLCYGTRHGVQLPTCDLMAVATEPFLLLVLLVVLASTCTLMLQLVMPGSLLRAGAWPPQANASAHSLPQAACIRSIAAFSRRRLQFHTHVNRQQPIASLHVCTFVLVSHPSLRQCRSDCASCLL
jgi:hypothetical protein